MLASKNGRGENPRSRAVIVQTTIQSRLEKACGLEKILVVRKERRNISSPRFPRLTASTTRLVVLPQQTLTYSLAPLPWRRYWMPAPPGS